jgi:hypothetical protein
VDVRSVSLLAPAPSHSHDLVPGASGERV